MLESIASYLDFIGWFGIQDVDPLWSGYPPRVLTLSDPPLSLDFWKCVDIKPHCRFRFISCDSFYGGVVKPGGSCAVFLRLLKLHPKCFLELTCIDLTGQCLQITQVGSIFTNRIIVLLPSLKTVVLCIVFESMNSFRRRDIGQVSAPSNLEDLTIRLVGSQSNEYDCFGILYPLITKAKRLLWTVEAGNWKKFVEKFPLPLPMLQKLELSDTLLNGLLTKCDNDLREPMPSLTSVVIHTENSVYFVNEIGKIGNFRRSCLHVRPLVWKSCHGTVPSEQAPLVRKIIYTAFKMCIPKRDLSIMEDFKNIISFSLRSVSWDCNTEHCMDFLPLLDNYKKLVNVSLPKELLLAWSKDRNFQLRLKDISGHFSLTSVRRLHFASCDRISDMSLVTSPEVLNGDLCDSMFEYIFRIFPNVETLLIDPVPYFRCGLPFLHLTTSTKLRKLVIVHSRKLLYDRSTRRLAFSTWLPHCKLEVFVLYTQQLNWLDESSENGLLDCLRKNKNLRYTCIVCEMSQGSTETTLTITDLERIAATWGDETRWQYLLFIFKFTTTIFCLTVKPKTRKCRNPRLFESNRFSNWIDLMSYYPELYSVFWRDLASVWSLVEG